MQPHEAFPNLALVKTYTTNGQTPDSAPTAATFNSGIKARNDVINVTDAVAVGDCAAGAADEVTLLSEIVSEAGKSVGMVSTARLTHATPAAVYGRTVDRDFEDDTLVPEGCGQLDLAAQMAEQVDAGVIDLAMGGGRQHFLPADVTDAEGDTGSRGDGRNLVEEMTSEAGVYVQTQEEFDAIDTATVEGPVIGLFESSHMQYEADRSGEPSLAEMAAAAIEVLSRNEDGYYLLIEAGRVDHANHAGNLARTVRDGRAFADAIATADEMTDDADTLIIVTADHDHGLQFNGYCGRGSDITGLCMQVDPAGTEHTGEPNLASDGLPYTVAGYMNGAGSVLVEQIAEAPAVEETGAGETGAAETPVEETAVEETAAGETTAGEPTAEEPAAGELAGAEPTAGEPTASEPAAAETAAADPTAGEPVAGQPVADISQPTAPDVGEAEGEAQPLYAGSRPEVTQEQATDIDYLQQALVPMPSETHSGTDVAIYAKGPWAHLFDGTIEQNVIFHVMNHAMNAGE